MNTIDTVFEIEYEKGAHNKFCLLEVSLLYVIFLHFSLQVFA